MNSVIKRSPYYLNNRGAVVATQVDYKPILAAPGLVGD